MTLTPSNPLPRAFTRFGIRHRVSSRNAAHADIRCFGLPSPTHHLAHCAHYVDRLPLGNSLRAATRAAIDAKRGEAYAATINDHRSRMQLLASDMDRNDWARSLEGAGYRVFQAV